MKYHYRKCCSTLGNNLVSEISHQSLSTHLVHRQAVVPLVWKLYTATCQLNLHAAFNDSGLTLAMPIGDAASEVAGAILSLHLRNGRAWETKDTVNEGRRRLHLS